MAGSTAVVKLSVGCRNGTACPTLDPETVALLNESSSTSSSVDNTDDFVVGGGGGDGGCGLVIVVGGLTADARIKNDAEGGTNACGCPKGSFSQHRVRSPVFPCTIARLSLLGVFLIDL